MENLNDYLGDGVYATQAENEGVWLLANDFDDPTDRIFLEFAVYEALKRFFERVEARLQEPPAED
jgi:hypothetical protein